MNQWRYSCQVCVVCLFVGVSVGVWMCVWGCVCVCVCVCVCASIMWDDEVGKGEGIGGYCLLIHLRIHLRISKLEFDFITTNNPSLFIPFCLHRPCMPVCPFSYIHPPLYCTHAHTHTPPPTHTPTPLHTHTPAPTHTPRHINQVGLIAGASLT